MAASDVEVVNSALHKLGARRISALSDSVKEAIVMNDLYDRLRKQLLREHPWNFAIAYVALAATVNTPVWSKQWTVEFTIPSDVLRVLETDLDDDTAWSIGYNVSGNKVIFTSADSLKIKYIKDITNTTRFDVSFDETFAFLLAANAAYAITGSQTVAQNMWNGYKATLGPARSYDAQENSLEAIQADEFTENVRG